MPTTRNGYSTGKKAVCVVDDNGLMLEELGKILEEKQVTMPGKISDQMIEAIMKENAALKRELSALEEEMNDMDQAQNRDQVLELETELARLKEYTLSDAKDLAKVLSTIDELFEKLPQKALDEFTSSEAFSLYEGVVDKYALSKDFED
ncbi:MAG: hypothetical protein KAT70_08915, partial [Thermoplasmata archaeon]|nr:hypothetical protein [Thermoplasmata archaeon]